MWTKIAFTDFLPILAIKNRVSSFGRTISENWDAEAINGRFRIKAVKINVQFINVNIYINIYFSFYI